MQAAWRTDEIRRRKPTPLDEMLLGLEYVKALFNILPKFARRIDSLLESIGQPKLPLDTVVVTFGSWMGGDRDGNPNVRPQTTRDVVITSRLAACNLYMDMVSVRTPAPPTPPCRPASHSPSTAPWTPCMRRMPICAAARRQTASRDAHTHGSRHHTHATQSPLWVAATQRYQAVPSGTWSREYRRRCEPRKRGCGPG